MRKLELRKKILVLLLVFCLLFSSICFAHSGRTDSSGGHKDNKNASGLGSYHYHCGGYPAHLHTGGVCPYTGGGSISSSSTSSSSSSSSTTTKTVQKNVTSIKVSDTSVELKVGESFEVTAEALPSTAEDKTLTWESNDETIAVVDSGEITGIADGNAIITVESVNGVKKTIKVKVNPIEVESIIVEKEIVLDVGQDIEINAEVSPSNSKDKTLIYEVLDENILKIEGNVLTGLAIGETTVTVKASNGIEEKINVKVNEPKTVIEENIILENEVVAVSSDNLDTNSSDGSGIVGLAALGGIGYYIAKKKKK